ncbi:MAG: hypothetical protein JSV88_26860, partial [Candidatus Aminicenantes bacterium]
PGNAPGGKVQTTAQALTRLGFLGFGADHPAVQRGAEYLFRFQREDGSWPLTPYSSGAEGEGNYEVISLQTSLPLRGLAACGYTADPRVEKAYAWLIKQKLADGAWPTGIAHGNYGGVAGYRRLAHSRWGCRANTIGALTCLALHPQWRHSPEAKRALDLVLACETKERHHLGFDVARIIGTEESKGFLTFYARSDMAQILDLCWRIKASLEDHRVAELVNDVKKLQGPYGLWEYQPKPQASRWVTFDILRSLSNLTRDTAWITTEPRTPFSPYPRRTKRY